MILDLITVCNRHRLKFEIIPDPHSADYMGCIIRLTSQDGIRMNRSINKHELEIIREDPDAHILNHVLPEMINDIEQCRRGLVCV